MYSNEQILVNNQDMKWACLIPQQCTDKRLVHYDEIDSYKKTKT